MFHAKKSWRQFVVSAIESRVKGVSVVLIVFTATITVAILSVFTVSIIVWKVMALRGANAYMDVTVREVLHDIILGFVNYPVPLHVINTFFALIAGYLIAQAMLNPVFQTINIQKRFIADASHELRTPLTVMKTTSEITLLNKKMLTVPQAVEAIEGNIEEINRMSRIISNLCHIAQLHISSTNEVPYEFTRVDLAKIAGDTIKMLTPLAQDKKVELILNADNQAVVRGNGTALGEVVTNLIRNAIAYTHTGGIVAVSVKKISGGRAELKVKDSGVGIEKKEIAHIFEPFYRGLGAAQHDRRGSGLGLAIVKEIIQRHNGTIHINSVPQKGTTVAVALKAA